MEQQIRKGLTGLLPTVLQDLVIEYAAPIVLFVGRDLNDIVRAKELIVHPRVIRFKSPYCTTWYHNFENFDFPFEIFDVDFAPLSWSWPGGEFRVEIEMEKVTVFHNNEQFVFPLKLNGTRHPQSPPGSPSS
jgi:hypothetical protein